MTRPVLTPREIASRLDVVRTRIQVLEDEVARARERIQVLEVRAGTLEDDVRAIVRGMGRLEGRLEKVER